MRIERDVMVVLSKLQIPPSGDRVVISEQLDRAMYTRVNRVLEALGGTWNRKAKAHLLPKAAERIDLALMTGEVETARDIGWFPTPEPLAGELVARANIKPGMRVLEPSAGTGSLVAPLLAAGADVFACEIDPDRAHVIEATFPGVPVFVGDFMDTRDTFDACVMNPPFTKSGKGDHLDHVRHAFSMLRPGGMLVSVLPSSVDFREDRRHREFREWAWPAASMVRLQSLPLFEPLPPGSFKASGTGVNAVVLVMRA